ncbi:MAG: zinc-ribbon domain-containing protein [Calditrichia bacterium]
MDEQNVLKGGKGINCPKCGKEIDEDAQFCKHCGASTEVEGEEKPETPTEPSEEPKETEAEELKVPPKKKKSRRKLAVVLIVIGLILASVFIWYFLSYEKVNEHKYYMYSPETAPSSLTLEIEMNGGATEIGFTSDPLDPMVYIDYHKRWEGPVISQPSFSTSSSKVSFDAGTVWGESNSELAVTLRSDVTYSIDIKTSNGALNFDSDIPGVSFGTLTIDTLNGASNLFISHATISGKIWVTTEDGDANFFLLNCTAQDIDATAKSGSSNIHLVNSTIGNIKSISHSGGLAVTSQDITINSDSTWTLEVNKGDIGLNIFQSKSMGADVTVNAKTEIWGDIHGSFEGNATIVRAKFTASASSGEVTLTDGEGFESPVSGSMQSSNLSNTSLDQFLVNLSTEDGNIEVEARNL